MNTSIFRGCGSILQPHATPKQSKQAAELKIGQPCGAEMTSKPTVGLIFSTDVKRSLESYHIAKYFACMLVDSGYAIAKLVPFGSVEGEAPWDGTSFVYARGNSSRPTTLMENISVGKWEDLQEVHLIVVCVDSQDSKPMAEKLVKEVKHLPQVPIFSLQKGVKNGSAIKEATEYKQVCVMDGALGFSVVETDGALRATNSSGYILYERVPKEHMEIADGPSNLMTHVRHTCVYQKLITVSTWGTLMCETIYAVNGLMGGTVRSNLMHYRCRLVYAAMIRESSKVLRAAARGGGWRPDLTLYALLPPKLFELMLCLPTPLFVMCCWLLGPFMRSSTISPIQEDLLAKRSTNIDATLGELVEAGKKYDVEMPVSNAVLERIKVLAENQSGVPNVTATALYQSVGSPYASYKELNYWIARLVVLIAVLGMLWYFFARNKTA